MSDDGLLDALAPVSNDAASDIAMSEPYIMRVTLVGVCPLLFHRWSCEAVAAKAAAAKGSKQKKTDNVESYVYRTDDGVLSVPGEYIRQSIIHAAKYRQDPRSSRKSAMDLYKAGLMTLSELCPLKNATGVPITTWDFLDQRRVVVQRNAITRERPALRKGWSAQCDIQVLLPEYIPVDTLHEVLTNAGRLVGLADFRPTFGRFRITEFRQLLPEEITYS